MDINNASNEYKYLNDLTLARIRDANLFWISSIGSLGVITMYASRLESWFLIFVELFLIPLFVYAISWQLDGIIRIRTYIGEFLEPKLGGQWESAWKKHPLIKRKYFIFNGVSLVYSLIYIVILAILDVLAFNVCEVKDAYFYICMSIANVMVIISCVFLYRSFSTRRFTAYQIGWENINKET